MRFASPATAQHFAASGLAAQTECCQSAQTIAAGFLSDQRPAGAKSAELYQKRDDRG